jgi:hypothetical protein
MFRFIRIAVLLTILVVVAGNQLMTGKRLNSWDKPLWLTIYPILADTDAGTERYVSGLTADAFRDINRFMQREAARFRQSFDSPIVVQVARPLDSLPPALPARNSGPGVALWSLKMRWWSFRNSAQEGLAPADIRMFVIFQRAPSNQVLERSVGIRNGGYGIVNAVASRQQEAHNRLVVAHELLHVLGATDKYDLATGQPISPDGLAEPGLAPLYPQSRAEIMAGRIAVSGNRWRLPAGLSQCVIGAATAREIGWLTDT